MSDEVDVEELTQNPEALAALVEKLRQARTALLTETKPIKRPKKPKKDNAVSFFD